MAVKKTKAADSKIMLAGKRECYNHLKHGMYNARRIYTVTEEVHAALLDLRDGQDNAIFRVPSKKDLDALKPVPAVAEGAEGEDFDNLDTANGQAGEDGAGGQGGEPL